MARIVSQMSVFEYTEIEALGDLERLELALSGLDDDALMDKLENRRGHGRNDYPIRALWNSLIAMRLFGHSTVESLRRELSRNSQLRRVLGYNDFSGKRHIVPPARVFSGFMRMLESLEGVLEEMFEKTVARLADLLPDYAVNIAGDGKYLDSYAKNLKKDPSKNSGRRGESDAAYSKKAYKSVGKDGKLREKTETHYGFRAHLICDVATELPVAFRVTPANNGERAEMAALLDSLPTELRERAKTLALDRGYDSGGMIKAVKGHGMAPIIDIRNCWKDGETTRQYKNTDIVYDYSGNVFFCESVGGETQLVKMKHRGYDSGKKCLRYSHKGEIHKIYVSYDERVFLPVARDSMKFRRLYAGRTAVERLNGRIDRDFMFERTCVRGLAKMRVSIALSLLTMNSMAIAKVRAGQTKRLSAFKAGLIPLAA